MSERTNPYITGLPLLGRRCDHCKASGIRCYEGAFFNDTTPGSVSMVLDERYNFAVPGKLDTCAIATGKIPIEQGVVSLRTAAEQQVRTVTRETVKRAIQEAAQDAREGVNYLDLDHNNWG
jgi:hypothetical protein